MVRKKTQCRDKITIDIGLALIAVVLILFGLVMLFSASVAVGLERFGDSTFFIKRQLFSLAVGGVLFYAGCRIQYLFWKRWSLMLLAGTLFLLVIVLIPGIGGAGQGAQRWIDLGVFTFQPTELAKLTIIIYMSAWLAEREQRTIQDLKHGIVPFITIIVILAALVLKQPDLGTLIIITLIGMVIFFSGGAQIKHLAAISGIGFVALLGAIKAAPYRLARLTAFLHPADDPQGAGYHIMQALLAVGSGGVFGLGLGHSRQKFLYLPEVTGDSIFAIIAEELGFVVSFLVIALFLAFFWRGMRIAQHAPDQFSRLTALGISFWIAGQAFVNIGAMLGVVPLTGLPLPLISYGGSSLITTLLGIGILFNISKHTV